MLGERIFAVVARYFARRKLRYLGSARLVAECFSPVLGTRWTKWVTAHFYASERGRRVIKGASPKDVCQTSKTVDRWYHDPDFGPFSMIPPNPSEFVRKLHAN